MRVNNFIRKAKLLYLAVSSAFVMGACKAYLVTVEAIYENNKILVKDEANDERLIDCSKKTDNNKNLLQDIPYFKKGDQVKLKKKNVFSDYNYDGRRVFGDDSSVKYNTDTIQIRKDREVIANVKARNAQRQ